MNGLGYGLGAFVAALFLAHVASVALALPRLRQRRSAEQPDLPGVTILRPVRGIENEIEATLGSGFLLDYPHYEIVFCVAHASDPVVPVVLDLIRRHPGVTARLLIGDERINGNPKLNNVLKGWRAARHDCIAMVDSNVLMPRDSLRRLLAEWVSGTGLVSSPPVGVAPVGWAAELECAFLNSHQLRWQLAADRLGFGFAQGKTMLLRRSILDAVGGIEALAREPAEDAAATRALNGAGYRVRLVAEPFPQPLGRRRFGEVWRRQLRWARLRRRTFAVLFLPEVLCGGAVPLPAFGWLAADRIEAAWLVLVAALVWYAPEAALTIGRGWPLSRRTPLMWVVRDLLLPPLWFAACAGNDFVWRGNAMTVAAARPAERNG